MQTLIFSRISFGIVLSASALLVACGGENEGRDASYSASTGTTAPSAEIRSQGFALHAQYCASCHGANGPGGAKNSGNTLAAIRNNKGGMGFLASSIQQTQSDAIAAYLAFGK